MGTITLSQHSELQFSVNDPPSGNTKLKSKVGIAKGPVLHWQKQMPHVLRPN